MSIMRKKATKPDLIDIIWLDTLIPVSQENDSCWLWAGNTNTGGYGQVSYNGKYILCHRATYEYAYGVIPDGYIIRHACNEKLCVRPEHLIIGTYSDNQRDRILETNNIPNLLRSSKFRANKKYFTELEMRFWSKVSIPENKEYCWVWIANKDDKGYGKFHHNETMMKAHRVSWILHYGDIPDGMCVCHTCDNRDCVNPNHLWLGTHQDNMKDRTQKKRSNFNIRGDKNHSAKYTQEQIENIIKLKEEGYSRHQISDKLNIPYLYIKRVLSGKHRK